MKNKIIMMVTVLTLAEPSTADFYDANAIEINLEQELTDSSSDDFESDTTATETPDSGTINLELESEDDAEDEDSEDADSEDTIEVTATDEQSDEQSDKATDEQSDKATTNTSKKSFPKTGEISLWDIVMDFIHSLIGKWF